VTSSGRAPDQPRPFRPFFLLAALAAVAGVLPWLPGGDAITPAGASIIAWHRHELLLGMIPAVLAGFVLTAMPRWTGRAPVSPATLTGLVVLWLTGRLAHLGLGDWATPLSAAFVFWLALIVGRELIAARETRNLKVALLLVLFAVAALVPDAGLGPLPAGFGLRLGLGCILALVLTMGGRLAPALTAAWLETRGEMYRRLGSPWIEPVAAAVAVAALGAWTLAPGVGATAMLCATACCAQFLRLARWQAWRVLESPAILAIHLAYAWIPLGFGLQALRAVRPELVGASAALHAWTVGAIGLACLSVMASMIRRQTGNPFAASRAMSFSLVCGFGAATARLLAESPDHDRASWLLLAALAWIAAFACFLTAFRRELLYRR
jgi:uncharacterized protein involved in response to NO